MKKNDSLPSHPGEHLSEFLEEYELSQYALAKALHVPARRVNEIVHGKRGISTDTAMRLGRYFGMSAQFWLNLQSTYDFKKAKVAFEAKIIAEVVPRVA